MSRSVESVDDEHGDCHSVGSGCSCVSSPGSCSLCEEEEFSGVLPNGWNRSWDDSGHVYYWHGRTRESRWTLKGIRLDTEDFEDGDATEDSQKDDSSCAQDSSVATSTHWSNDASSSQVKSHSLSQEENTAVDTTSCESQGSIPRSSKLLKSPGPSEISPTVPGVGLAESVLGNAPISDEKRIHNEMKQRLSSLVIQGLLPFHLGSNESRHSVEPPRIGSSVEFKKLARKLTHTLQEKEEGKARSKGAPLRITDRVRCRVRDYVQAYVKQHCEVLSVSHEPEARGENRSPF